MRYPGEIERPLRDYEVDRAGVEVPRGMKRTATNRSRAYLLSREPRLKERSDAQACANRLVRCAERSRTSIMSGSFFCIVLRELRKKLS